MVSLVTYGLFPNDTLLLKLLLELTFHTVFKKAGKTQCSICVGSNSTQAGT